MSPPMPPVPSMPPMRSMMDAETGKPPIGAVLPYAGPAATPQDQANLAACGWLVCDGHELACAEYPMLFAVIGATQGETGGRFRLPDLCRAAPFGAGLTPIIRYR